ncbi:mitofilin family membrane protein [Telmatospirillum sp.]|uniref:COG4223 family protein n=1 Tax=Telmatospirillum sp. TaxID=2079197 RepID=UPI00283EAAF8|nr:mitofilin family membrane protein [Telmatospirillum sp.]MDR3438232.1 mitofilin family membrane protein [Telmatospirillum sp.]
MSQDTKSGTDNVPDDAAPPVEEITESSEKPSTSSPALRAFVGGLAGGLIISLAAVAGLAAAWPTVRPFVLADQDRRLDSLDRAIDDLNPRLVAIEREQPERSQGGETAGLARRVATLEAQTRTPLADPRIGAASEQSERLASDVARLAADIQTLRAAIPPEGTILRLAERAESAERQVHDIATRNASAQAQLLVVGQLREAVNRGDPYQPELAAARRVAGPDTLATLDSLAATSADGVPRKEVLIDTFPKIAVDILHAGVLSPDGSFWQKALYKLSSLVSIRRIDGQGSSTAAIVARSEALVRVGDLTRATQELSALSEEPAKVAEPWIKAATARTAADRTLSELSATVAAEARATPR